MVVLLWGKSKVYLNDYSESVQDYNIIEYLDIGNGSQNTIGCITIPNYLIIHAKLRESEWKAIGF